MRLEAKEPTFPGLVEVSPALAHMTVARRIADEGRLGVNQVKHWLAAKERSAGDQ
jgi:hypothetical protein